MEFPHLGQHCNESTCNRLDFLPVKCDSCDKVFCASHYSYERHSCPGAYKKNVQVPVCPLCGEPVPTAPGVAPDLTVSQHIDKQCKSDSKKIYTNRCNAKGCKRKELIPVKCTQCHLNFCLRHRHTSDHDCKNTTTKANPLPEAIATRSMAARAAENRRHNTTSREARSTQIQNVQGNMTEDEALAYALSLSMMDQNQNGQNAPTATQAATANNSQRVPVGGRDAQQSNGKDKCSLS